MRNLFAVFCIFLFSVSLPASGQPTDSLLKVLDLTVKERFKYSRKRELRMDSLRMRLSRVTDEEQHFHIYQRLFTELRYYRMDSALWVANERLRLAERLDNPSYMNSSRLNIAEVLGVTGMYKEATDLLGSIRKEELDMKQQAYYFHLYHSIYSLMKENAFSGKIRQEYEQLVYELKDSLLLFNEPGTLGHYFIVNSKLVQTGRYDEALELMKWCYEEFAYKENARGGMVYELANIYRQQGNTEEEKRYLAMSAIIDLQKGVKEYIALYQLALLLYQEGDIDRAYAYIKCAVEDAAFCKARFRTLEMSEALPIIAAAYNKKEKQDKDNLVSYLLVISLMSVVLVIGVVYIYFQLKKISSAKQAMKVMYEDMKEMNTELNTLNKELKDTNQVKEAYIGSVFNICSDYIDKMEAYRINLNRKLKGGKVEEALRVTGSTSLVADELKEFFRNFDTVFLNIYPGFVEQFNELLLKEERIIPRAGDILTPELRVFALIRLGITDSSKIAGFLHYSPQTVYNYKLKIRNKLAIPREEFEEALHRIGR